MNKESLQIIANILSNNVKWAIFGGVAIAIHYGSLYRDFGDIDIIIEDNEKKLNQLIPGLINCDRKNRKKRCIKMNGVSVEFMLMTGQNEIALADGKFKFNSIEKIKFDNANILAVDLQSLYCAKLRHKKSLESELEKYKTKLDNCNKDIQIIKDLLKK